MSDVPNLSHPHRSFALVGLAACGDSQPSASDWAADVNGICEEINATRNEVVTKHLPSDTAPTRDQLMAFFADFGAGFRAYGDRLTDVERPADLDAEIDELFAAFYAVVDEIDQASTDPAAAQAHIETAGDTAAGQRLVQISTDLGLDTCVG